MKDLTKGNITKNLFIYAIPAILATLLSRTYSTVDSIMVGKILGETGLAAIGSTTSFMTALSALLWGMGTGISLYIGYLISANKKEQAVRAIKSNLLFLMIISLIVMILAIVFCRPIFSLLYINDEIYNDALTYYVIIMTCKCFSTFNSCVNDIFFITGNSSHAMKTSIVNCVINICLNYLFMAVFKWGVFGAAIATFISLLIVFIYNVFAIKKLYVGLTSVKQPIKLYKEEIVSAFKLAIPCMLQQGIMYVASAVVQPVANRLGNSAIAAFSVCTTLYNICTIFFFSASKGLMAFGSQCYSSGKIQLIKRGFLTSLGLAISFTAPIVILMLIFPNLVAFCFLQDAVGQTAEYIIRYITLCFPFLFLAILNNLFHNFFRSVLKPLLTTITSAVCSITYIAFSFALTPSLAMDGIYWSFIISWASECIVCLIIFFSNVWKTQRYKELEKTCKANNH